MFRNFLISALRNLQNNKFQSLIQILSLAVGLTVFSMIALYLYDELTVDAANKDSERIFRIENLNAVGTNTAIPYALGPFLQENIPEIRHMTRIHSSNPMITSLTDSGEVLNQIRVHEAEVDSGYFDIFPHEFLLGNPRAMLRERGSAVISENIAEILFGDANPLGRTIYINDRERTITGIIGEPLNTHLKYEVLTPIGFLLQDRAEMGHATDDRSIFIQKRPTYIFLHDPHSREKVEKKIAEYYLLLENRIRKDEENVPREISLCPLRKVHFSELIPMNAYMDGTEKRVLMIFALLGISILGISIINYINICTARASLRGREIALRKIAGSTRGKLVLYFLTETAITTLLSFLVAVTCLQIFFPKFNHLMEADINLYFLKSPVTWAITAVAVLFIGILSGIYPALRMSSGSSVSVIASEQMLGSKETLIRRILMTIQFTVAVILMIGATGMLLQIRYMKARNLGFDPEQLLWTRVGDLSRPLRQELLSRLDRYSEIEIACLSDGIPGKYGIATTTYDNPGHPLHGIDFDHFAVSVEFFQVYGLNLTHGSEILERPSLRWDTGDPNSKITSPWDLIINETCRKVCDLEDPVGFRMTERFIVSGVVEDFHSQSLQYPVKPMVFTVLPPGQGWLLTMKINTRNFNKTLRNIDREIYELRNPEHGREGIYINTNRYHFLDESFNEQYQKEENIFRAFSVFFILAIIIACMGLLGLSTFMAQRRTKEIGIRKVMGSSEREVFLVLARDFMKWVGLSLIIGCPAGWLVIRIWQRQFAYKAEIGIWVYLVTALIALGIALLTVVWQSLKTARANPVDSLRYE